MDFKRIFEPESALVEKKKKASTFTVREIGGPAEIIKWREVQAAKEMAYRVRLGERDSRIKAFEQESGLSLATPTIHTSSWEEKQAFAQSERKRLATLEEVASCPYQPEPEPRRTILTRVTAFFKRLWKQANF